MKKYKAKQTRKEIINKAADRLKQLLKTEGKNWKKGWSSTIAELQLPVKISDGKNKIEIDIEKIEKPNLDEE